MLLFWIRLAVYKRGNTALTVKIGTSQQDNRINFLTRLNCVPLSLIFLIIKSASSVTRTTTTSCVPTLIKLMYQRITLLD